MGGGVRRGRGEFFGLYLVKWRGDPMSGHPGADAARSRTAGPGRGAWASTVAAPPARCGLRGLGLRASPCGRRRRHCALGGGRPRAPRVSGFHRCVQASAVAHNDPRCPSALLNMGRPDLQAQPRLVGSLCVTCAHHLSTIYRGTRTVPPHPCHTPNCRSGTARNCITS